MDFVPELPVLTSWKSKTYDLILIIVDKDTKIVHYKVIKVTINAPGLIKIMIEEVMRHHSLPD